jgi:hypothetical protein
MNEALYASHPDLAQRSASPITDLMMAGVRIQSDCQDVELRVEHILLAILQEKDLMLDMLFESLKVRVGYFKNAVERALIIERTNDPYERLEECCTHPAISPLYAKLRDREAAFETAVADQEFSDAASIRAELDKIKAELKSVLQSLSPQDG